MYIETNSKRKREALRRQRLVTGNPVLYKQRHSALRTVSVIMLMLVLGIGTSLAVVPEMPFVRAESKKEVCKSGSAVCSTILLAIPSNIATKVMCSDMITTRVEESYVAPTTHEQLSSRIISYNVSVGVYDYAFTLYSKTSDERILSEVDMLMPGDSATVVPREGITLTITNTIEANPDEGDVYIQRVSDCATTEIDVDVEKCGYFTLNGDNVMATTDIDYIQSLLEIEMVQDNDGVYRYNNDYVELSFRYNNGILQQFVAKTIADVSTDDAYPTMLLNRSVVKPERIYLQFNDVNDIDYVDVTEVPVVLGGYSLGNWTTVDNVVDAYGAIRDDVPSCVVGSKVVYFIFDNGYLCNVRVV